MEFLKSNNVKILEFSPKKGIKDYDSLKIDISSFFKDKEGSSQQTEEIQMIKHN